MIDGKLKLALLNLLMCKMTDKLSSQKGFHLEIVIDSVKIMQTVPLNRPISLPFITTNFNKHHASSIHGGL